MSPIVPGFSSKPALIERTVEACAAHGVRIAGGNVMHLEEGPATHFFAWLEREHPEFVQRYRATLSGQERRRRPIRKEVARVLSDARAKAEKKGPHARSL